MSMWRADTDATLAQTQTATDTKRPRGIEKKMICC